MDLGRGDPHDSNLMAHLRNNPESNNLLIFMKDPSYNYSAKVKPIIKSITGTESYKPQ
jgi:hypothetical protein